MLKKLFGSGKKKDGFYLELDENAAAKNAVETVTTSEPVQAVVETAEKPAAEKAAKKPAAKNGKVKAKAKKSAQPAAKNGKSPAPKAKPVGSGASSFDPPFWVKAMSAGNNGNGANGEKSGQTFATDYLMPVITNSRRRPGPSLDKFKDMAKKTRGSRI